MMLDGTRYGGRLPCLLCRHARQRKTPEQWRTVCGVCRTLTPEELGILYWNQECDADRVVVPPNMLRLSRRNSDARYAAARENLVAWGLRPRARLLDIGCGISAQAAMFREFQYVGADINTPRLGYGARTHSWARYSVQSVAAMGFGDASFDAVLCLEVIEHLPPNLQLALAREVFRVLAPKGLLVVSTPDGRMTPWKRVFGAKCERSHHRELCRAEVESLLRQAGGRLLDCRPVDNLVQPAGRLPAVLAHLAADRPTWRRRLTELWARAGYGTLLYLASHA